MRDEWTKDGEFFIMPILFVGAGLIFVFAVIGVNFFMAKDLSMLGPGTVVSKEHRPVVYSRDFSLVERQIATPEMYVLGVDDDEDGIEDRKVQVHSNVYNKHDVHDQYSNITGTVLEGENA